MLKINKFICFTVFVLFATSCSSDSKTDTTPTPTAITYTNTVKSIITSNCINCHGVPTDNGASVSLDTYTKVKNAVTNDQLIELISKAQGDGQLMPYNGTRLPQTTIDKVLSWKNEGFKE